jgi:hypothetical protein
MALHKSKDSPVAVVADRTAPRNVILTQFEDVPSLSPIQSRVRAMKIVLTNLVCLLS